MRLQRMRLIADDHADVPVLEVIRNGGCGVVGHNINVVVGPVPNHEILACDYGGLWSFGKKRRR